MILKSYTQNDFTFYISTCHALLREQWGTTLNCLLGLLLVSSNCALHKAAYAIHTAIVDNQADHIIHRYDEANHDSTHVGVSYNLLQELENSTNQSVDVAATASLIPRLGDIISQERELHKPNSWTVTCFSYSAHTREFRLSTSFTSPPPPPFFLKIGSRRVLE